MTLISLVILKLLRVISLSCLDTAVTPSELLMLNSTTGLKDESVPTREMSVPCRVVIIGMYLPCDCSICLAMYATAA